MSEIPDNISLPCSAEEVDTFLSELQSGTLRMLESVQSDILVHAAFLEFVIRNFNVISCFSDIKYHSLLSLMFKHYFRLYRKMWTNSTHSKTQKRSEMSSFNVNRDLRMIRCWKLRRRRVKSSKDC